MNLHALLPLAFLFTTVSFAAPAANVGVPSVVITGRLVERGTKIPIADADVYILPAKLKGVTDADGKFRIENVPEGDFEFIVNVTGYLKLSKRDSQFASDPEFERKLYLQRDSYQVYETTVYGKMDTGDDSAKSMKASVAQNLPGSNNDAVKAIQNMPGVSRAAAFSSQIIIEGSAPQDTQYLIDGQEVPIMFHFGGFSSVVMPEALDRVDYLAAGYGVEYGRAMGGIVAVWTKKPDRDRTKGFVYADFINSGGQIQTPVGEKGSLSLGIRRSYIGEFLKAASSHDQSSTNKTELTAAPEFEDLSLIYDQPLSPQDDFRVSVIGSEDTLSFIETDAPDNNPSLRGNFDTETAFVRVIPSWTHRYSAQTTSRLSLGIGRDWQKVVLDDQYFRLQLDAITTRYELEHHWSENFFSTFGLDNRLEWANVALNFPDFYNSGGVTNPIATGTQKNVNLDTESHKYGLYWNNEVKLTPVWSIQPGLRFDYFQAIHEGHLSPRFAIKRILTPFSSIRFATGLYYQPPLEQESATGLGNPDLTAPHALHLAVDYDRDFREGSSKGWVFDGGPFFRKFYNLVEPTSATTTVNGVATPEFYDNGETGRAYGLQTLLRYEANPWTGWVAYTVGRSTRTQPGQPEYLSQYDQTQNLDVIVGRDLPRNWKIAARFRYVTGNPITPVTGSVYDTDNDAYIPIRGPYFSQRVNAFYQLDIRVDKKWIFNRGIMTAYLDLENATNHKNIENVSYSYDYNEREDASGLPILPIVGLKGEF